MLLLRGKAEAYDQVFRFEQDPNFYYLTGWSEPGAALLLTPSDEILFLPSHDNRVRKNTPASAHPLTMPTRARSPVSKKFCRSKSSKRSWMGRSNSHERMYAPWTESYAAQLRSRYPFREVADASPLIAKLRVKKSDAEIAAIQHATDVSVEAHRTAWKHLAAGRYEYQIAAVFLDTFLDQAARARPIRPSSARARMAPSCTTVEPAAHGSRRVGGHRCGR